MQDRIRKIVEYSGLNQAMFAEKIAVAPATLSNILKYKSKPSLEQVLSIRAAFPEINFEWLLDGKGEMLSDSNTLPSQSTPSSSHEPALDFEAGDLFSTPSVSAGAQPVSNRSVPVSPSSISDQIRFAGKPGNPQDIQMVKIIDKPLRSVKEIQVFYDDGTYEVFVHRK